MENPRRYGAGPFRVAILHGGPGAAGEMAPVLEKYKSFMDTPEEVSRGILRQLDSERLIVFPTEKPARAYEKARDI